MEGFDNVDDADKLLQSLGDGAAPEAPATHYGGIENTIFEKALVEATGGKVKSTRELFGLTENNERYQQASQRATELEGALNGAYANDKIKTLNDLYKKGASDAEIENFWKVQKFDVSKMSPLEKVRAAALLDNPDYTEEDLNNYVSSKYGATTEDELESMAKTTLKTDQRLAEERIKQAQINSGETEKERLGRAQNEQYQKAHQGWSKVMNGHYGNMKTTNIEVPSADGKTMVQVPFDVPDNTRKMAAEQMAQMATQQGWKFTAEDMQSKGNAVFEQLLFALHGKEIVARAVAQATANTVKEQRRSVHGMGYPPMGSGNQNQHKDNSPETKTKQAGYDFFNKK